MIWKSVPGFEESYEVSEGGQVRSLDRELVNKAGSLQRIPGKLLNPVIQPSGHLRVNLYREGKGHPALVHQLVMRAFVGEPSPGEEVRHLDGDPTNNQLGNLKYGTRRENMLDMSLHGDNYNMQKDRCSRGHLLELPNLKKSVWEAKGYRYCLACHRASGYTSYHRDLKDQEQQISDNYYKRIMEENYDRDYPL